MMMGRAEKRMAKRRQKKGPQYTGGRPMGAGNAVDKLPRSTVLKRLSEVPVFGIKVLIGSEAPATSSGFLVQDGEEVSNFYMDAREAEKVVAAASNRNELRVVGVPLDTIYFDTSVRLKPASRGMEEAATIPAERALVPGVSMPLFCIDGMQTTAKDTGVNSLPLFFSKAELLQFAGPVYGSQEAPKMVLVTDLEVVVDNMLKGPAGLLRDARFFADAKALTWMDQTAKETKTALFPTQGTLDNQRQQGVFGNLKLPWD